MYLFYTPYLFISQITKFKFNRRKQRKLPYERSDIQFTVGCLNLKHICSHVPLSSSLNCYLTVVILVSVPALLVSPHSHVYDTLYLYHVGRTHGAEHIFSKCFMFIYIYIYIQWNLDLSFFKGLEKQKDECGKTINPGNYYTL
jgi:hypothetical protein